MYSQAIKPHQIRKGVGDDIMTNLFANLANGQLTLNTYRSATGVATDIQDIVQAHNDETNETLTASIDSLHDLKYVLNTFNINTERVDFSDLPTWGDAPDDTCDIFSYDNDWVMIQDCNGRFCLENR